jgi:hypothetical protein
MQPEAETGKTRRAGMSQPLLAVEGLMMRFGGLLAVNNVALESSAPAGPAMADRAV